MCLYNKLSENLLLSAEAEVLASCTKDQVRICIRHAGIEVGTALPHMHV